MLSWLHRGTGTGTWQSSHGPSHLSPVQHPGHIVAGSEVHYAQHTTREDAFSILNAVFHVLSREQELVRDWEAVVNSVHSESEIVYVIKFDHNN